MKPAIASSAIASHETGGIASVTSRLLEKQSALLRNLARLESLLVAYSGGTDSAYLAYMAFQVLGPAMRAVIADSPSLARAHFEDAVRFADEVSLPLEIVRTEEMADPEYVVNNSNRCFHCKHELFEVMERSRQKLSFAHLAFGMNADDRGEHRPGHRAADAHRVLAPLAEVELSKREIRTLARIEGLRIWDKPASACLSSRIEYGRPVTLEALSKIEAGEAILHDLGFSQVRVRYHGELVRIEIAPEEMTRAFSPAMARAFAARFKSLGFTYVTLDCEGYRSGSMNAVLPITALRAAIPSFPAEGQQAARRIVEEE